MQKDWFPFFSMLFWLFTKLGGLSFALMGVWGLVGMSQVGFQFGLLVFGVLTPLALGYVLLVTEIVFDIATAEQRRRQAVAK